MRIYNLPIATLAFLLLILAAPALAAITTLEQTQALALEQGKAEAADLLAKGEAMQAYELYMRLLRTAPDDDAINLGLARSATGAKRWNQAVLAYENLLEKYPREAGLYGELANVYMLLGDREAAERSLAVKRALTGEGQKETAQALDTLESRYSDLQIHGKVRAGLQYDSNANLGPDSNDLTLGAWKIQLDNAEAKGALGAYVGAELDLGYRFFRDSPWWLVGDVQGFWRGHANSSLHKAHSQEAQWGRAAVGMRHLSASTLAELRLKAEIFDYEFYQNVASYGPEGTLIWAVDPSLQLILKGNLEKRDYSRDRLHNGLYGSAGLYTRVFLGEDKHELLLGGRFLGADADKSDYGYNGWEGTARLLFKLPHGFELTPFFVYSQEFYKGPATALESSNRRDNRLRAGLSLTYRITEAWAVEAMYQYTRNNSNSALYDYGQNFFSIGVVWSF
jgi:hypothetical protein